MSDERTEIERRARHVLDDPETWRPRALVWTEVVASEVFDAAEKLLVVSAFGAAAAATGSAAARAIADALTVLLALYITVRLDRGFLAVFSSRRVPPTLGLVLYLAAGLVLVWLLAGVILPGITTAIEELIVAALE